MKIYVLSPLQIPNYLAPDEVASRLRQAFLNVDVSSEVAQKQAEVILSKFRLLMQAGFGGATASKLEELEARWSGAISIVVCTGHLDGEWFQTMACQATPLHLVFGPGIPGRNRRSIAKKAATILSYTVESVDGD